MKSETDPLTIHHIPDPPDTPQTHQTLPRCCKNYVFIRDPIRDPIRVPFRDPTFDLISHPIPSPDFWLVWIKLAWLT